MAGVPLFARYPKLAAALPRAPLCDLPTPVSPAEKLGARIGGGPLWIKRDDLSAEPYGGNKPRKLEWILGRALAEGRRRVLTTGGLGTNHGLATALYARRLGLACDLVLIHQPVDARVRDRLLQHRAVGAELLYGRNVAGAALRVAARLARHPRTLYVPTGGSSATGIAGFVNAGLELAEQVRSGDLPEPARIYVPLGSGGSVAGLAAGLALAGLGARVVAVLVSDVFPPGERRLRRMAGAALRRLRRGGADLEVAPPLAFEIERRFVGAGYGHATPEGGAAVREAASLEGLALETTYTGKTLAALRERERGRSEPVLFWNTHAAHEPELALGGPEGLPRPLRALFAESP